MAAPVQIATITAKGQMTIPKAVREAARLAEGDRVVVVVEEGRIILRKLEQPADPWLAGLETTLEAWDSPEDEEAWRDL